MAHNFILKTDMEHFKRYTGSDVWFSSGHLHPVFPAPDASFSPARPWEAARDASRRLGSTHSREDLDSVSGSWAQSSPALAVADIGELTQKVGELSKI